MATYAMTIDGSAVVPQIRTLRITAPANGSATLECSYNVTSASSAPAIDDELILTENATAIFGGYIAAVTIAGYGGEPTDGMTLSIIANDYNQLADRRFIGTLIGGVAFAAGTTLKDALTVVVAYIPGASLHASQVNGPAFTDTMVVYAQSVRQTLDQLTTLTGYVWQIDSNKKLRMFAPGDISAPFSITDGDGHTIGDIRVKPTRDDFANRVFVLGTGVIGIAEDAVSIAADGEHEYCAQSTDITDQGQADALASAILAQKVQTLTEIEYSTRELGLIPGQAQTVVNTERGISTIATVTQVNTEYVTGAQAVRHVTVTAGGLFKSTWQQKTADMFSGFSTGGAVTILTNGILSQGGGYPVISGLTSWINQGGASADTTHGGILLVDGSPSGGNNVRLLKQTAPSTPYTITAGFTGWVPIQQNFLNFGLAFRESSSGKLSTCHLQSTSAVTPASFALRSQKYNSPTSSTTSYVAYPTDLAGMIYLRISDDGTNRKCYISADGINFSQFHSVARTDFLTANEVGFFVESNNATFSASVWLTSWVIA